MHIFSSLSQKRIPWLDLLFLLVILGVTAWGYYGVLDDFFIMDDFDMIRGHSSFSQFWEHWHSPVGANSYRPLIDLLFIWDFYSSGWNPFGWHLSNLIFHIINALFVYGLTNYLVQSRFAALTAGVLFGLHTSHTEAVSWISARMDVVSATFFLLSLWYFIAATGHPRPVHAERTKKRWAYILSLLWFACALFVKEMAVTLPFIVILYDWCFAADWQFRWQSLKLKARRFLPYFIVLMVYFGMRFWALHEFKGGYDVQLFGWFIIDNLTTYFKFLATPFTEEIFTQSLLLNSIGIAVLTLLCVWLSRASRFMMLWIFITLLPVYAFTLGRGVYLASVGFCMLMGFVLTFNPGKLAQASFHKRVIDTLRYGVRVFQAALIIVIFIRYGVALRESNAWWGNVAAINETVPLMVKSFFPTFPKGTRLCFQNLPIVFNQRFNGAFYFQFPEARSAKIYTQNFTECAPTNTSDDLRNRFFLYYDRNARVLYDLSVETRAAFLSQESIVEQRFDREAVHQISPQAPRLSIALNVNASCSAIGIVTSLGNGIEIPQGTLIARGQIDGAQGTISPFEIVAGQDTAEWAIRFPAVQSIVKHAMPPAYRAWTVQQPDGTFAIAQNYQKQVPLPAASVLVHVSLEFAPSANLPPNVSLDVDRLRCYPEGTVE